MDPLPALADIARRLDAGSLSSTALVEQCLASIARVDGRVGAFLDVDAASARAQAEASDARRAQKRPLSSFDGVVVAIKDNIAVQGAPLTAGSKVLAGYRSPYDATVTTKLKTAGAVILGRLNCDEFAMGGSTENIVTSMATNLEESIKTQFTSEARPS